MDSLLLLILSMAVVTYFSRVAPFFLLPASATPKRLERLLAYVPAAALGSLLFPDLLYGPPGHRWAALLAAAVAALLATRSKALGITVGGAILVTFLAISLGAV